MPQTLSKIWQNKYVQVIIDYFSRLDLGYASASIAYFSLLSIFPLLIVIGNLLSIVGLELDSVLRFLATFLPESIISILQPIVKSILFQNGIGVLSISLIVTLWSVTRLVASIRLSQNQIYGVPAKNIAIIDRFVSLFWLVLILSIASALLLFAAVGSNVLDLLPINADTVRTLKSAKPLIVFVGLFITLTLFNWLLPTKKPWLPWAVTGTIIEVLFMMVSAHFFSLYVGFIAQAYSFYQAINSVIITMVWMNFIAFVGLLGTIITAILNHLWPARDKNSRQKIVQLSQKMHITK
ncbi:YihY/virulence factor BrkB family protein [Weissella tructae]|uniref:YihY family protein n=2 Tax=Weissella TaxID=46255 RepID=A0A075TUF0_9LACO|nr:MULTISPECIES: YihY/virulence factor BrkB family protein [Weissella]AIG65174.1 YihY family protein [Weissella tructae]AIM62487.1 YihY family protein [Weissella ceti]AIM63823.1 YihY family protein [Weissella ceti]ELA07961.1 integral membrane protein [Weissella ceti NC36]QVV91559.1 YihY/virulence factor BrkB family protein [Weissella tructae]